MKNAAGLPFLFCYHGAQIQDSPRLLSLLRKEIEKARAETKRIVNLAVRCPLMMPALHISG